MKILIQKEKHISYKVFKKLLHLANKFALNSIISLKKSRTSSELVLTSCYTMIYLAVHKDNKLLCKNTQTIAKYKLIINSKYKK